MKHLFRNGGAGFVRVALAAGLAMTPIAATAGEVALKSADGTVNLVGEFIEFKDDNYVIRTALGDLRISASRVRCEGDDCPVFTTTAADVVIAGSDTVGLGLMPLLMSGYASYLEAEASVVNTETEGQIVASFIGDGGFGDELGSYLVTSTSSGDAFTGLLDGSAAIGMASRRIKPSEARELRDAGAGNMVSTSQEHVVAVDSLVMIVNPNNPVDTISIEQLRDIYSGSVTNWSEIGGPDLPIQVITRQQGSGTLSVFENRIFGDDAPATPEAFQVADDNNVVAAAVNETEGAIGFVGYAFQRGAKALNLINECGIESTPDAFSASTEEYAIQRRLYLYNTEAADQKALDFVKFTQSEEADGVIAKSGFIDLGVKVREQSMESARARTLINTEADAFEGAVIREMLAEMLKSDRLSTTFRFRTGSSKLDERGELDMARLTNYLEDMPEGTKVTMVGFTDSVGAFEANGALSVGRAQQVVDDLRAFAGDRLSNVEFAATGFGEVSPAACNIDENGRSVNRRVEVWIEKGAEG